VLVLWIDIVWAGRLYQSLLTYDMIKHAAITRAIVEAGVTPPHDPFFARNGAATFYYFYFVPAAMAELLAGGLIDSRAAVGGQVVWTGIALFGLALHVYRAGDFRAGAMAAPVLGGLGLVAGLQILTATMMRLMTGNWIGQSNWANEIIGGWVVSVLWVPHHIAGFIASWVALLLLIDANIARGLKTRATCVGLAGLALASAAGLSLWVTFGTVAAVAVWGLVLLKERNLQAVGHLSVAGLTSLLVAAPYLAGLVQNNPGDVAPVSIAIRSFFYVEVFAASLDLDGTSVWHNLLRLVALPLNYGHELGIFAIGGLLYWRRHGSLGRVWHGRNEVARMLLITTGTSFTIGTFLASSISNNDLGWRVMLFAQLATLIWTTHLVWPFWHRARATLSRATLFGRMPVSLAGLLVLGLASVAYDVVMLRSAYAFGIKMNGGDLRDPATDHDVRRAFSWINENVSRHLVLQHNPDAKRVFGYALYGHHRVGVADLNSGFLLGAEKSAVEQRLTDLIPVFRNHLSADQVGAVARQHGVQILLVTAADPIWHTRPAWLDKTPALFATDRVRVLAVDRLTH
jgi:hypothetical protein